MAGEECALPPPWGQTGGAACRIHPLFPATPRCPPALTPAPAMGPTPPPPPFVLCTGRPPTHPSVPHTHIPGPRVGVGGLSGGGGSLLHQGELQDALQLLFLLPRPPLGFLLLPRRQRHGQAQLLREAAVAGLGGGAAAVLRAGPRLQQQALLQRPAGQRCGRNPLGPRAPQRRPRSAVPPPPLSRPPPGGAARTAPAAAPRRRAAGAAAPGGRWSAPPTRSPARGGAGGGASRRAGPRGGRGLRGARSHLLGLGAGVQQALLDGELQKVVVFVPQRLAAPRSQHRVSRRHLEHRRLHLARERPSCSTAPLGTPGTDPVSVPTHNPSLPL